MTAPELTTYSIALPVHLGRQIGSKLVQGAGPIQGTCFPIGGPFMLTAGHVVQALHEAERNGHDVAAVGVFHPRNFQQFGVRVVESEVLGKDIGLLQVAFDSQEQEEWLFPLHWDFANQDIGSGVRSPGFAYGDHKVENERYIIQRSFQGSIVANIGAYLPSGMSGRPFGVIETSFAAPRGHSGAPLLQTNGRVIGVVIGNSKSRMLVLDNEEIEESTGAKTIVQQYESLSLGIAVAASEIAGMMARGLDTTVGAFLASSGRAHG